MRSLKDQLSNFLAAEAAAPLAQNPVLRGNTIDRVELPDGVRVERFHRVGGNKVRCVLRGSADDLRTAERDWRAQWPGPYDPETRYTDPETLVLERRDRAY